MMRMWPRVLLGCLVLAASLALLWQWLQSSPEPSYQGTKLSVWLAQGPAGFDRGADAFLQQNSEVVTRYLISLLRKGDNALWKPYVWLRQHAPRFVVKQMPVWLEPKLVRAGATYWLAQLGARAAVAVPALRETGSEDRSPEVRRGALWALGRTDSSNETITLMLKALSSDKDAEARRAAAGALEVWAPDDPKVISALIGGLGDSDAMVQQISAAALGKYGSKAYAALQPLQQLLGKDSIAADYAAAALKQIQGQDPRELRNK